MLNLIIENVISEKNIFALSTDYAGDKWGFWVTKRWFVGCTGCTLQTLVCLASERFYMVVWLESLFIGSYIYHSGHDNWHTTMLLI